jgi:hypothetical protein
MFNSNLLSPQGQQRVLPSVSFARTIIAIDRCACCSRFAARRIALERGQVFVLAEEGKIMFSLVEVDPHHPVASNRSNRDPATSSLLHKQLTYPSPDFNNGVRPKLNKTSNLDASSPHLKRWTRLSSPLGLMLKAWSGCRTLRAVNTSTPVDQNLIFEYLKRTRMTTMEKQEMIPS